MGPSSDGAGWPNHPLYCRCLPCARSAIRSILVHCSRYSGCLSCLAVPPPCLLCSPLSLLMGLPRSVCLCCSSPCLLVLLGAPVMHPLLSHPPAPLYEGFTSPRDVDCPVHGWLVTALLPPLWRAPPDARGAVPGARGAVPALVEYIGTL